MLYAEDANPNLIEALQKTKMKKKKKEEAKSMLESGKI